MALTGITKQLYKASREHYAVPLFDVFEMQGAKGAFEAIAAKKAPAIVAVYAHLVFAPDAEAFVNYLRTMANQSDMPISIMLDHGATVEQCARAIELGFTDVMFDGSQLPYEENVNKTKSVVEMAHPKGVGVEAELGHVGTAADYEDFAGKGQGFTDPESVQPFIDATGVDFLAVAFGTAHGVSKNNPKLNLDLLGDIAKEVDLPLVMHGGSGLTDEQFQQAIAAGIAKVNVSTNLVIAATQMMMQNANQPDASLFSMLGMVSEAYKQGCGKIFDLFGTTGKGSAV